MRCRKFHTVLMDSDPECPVCHAAPIAGPGVADYKSDSSGNAGVRALVGFAGGLVGLAIYDSLTSSGSDQQPARGSRGRAAGPRPRRSSGAGRRFVGLVVLCLGVGLVVLGVQQFLDIRDAVPQKPHVVTAAELVKAEGPEAPPEGWISYTFTKGKDTGFRIARRRLARSGEVQATIVIVQVEEKWLIASVPPDFDSNRLVGRLQPLDPPASQDLVRRIRQGQPTPINLLPYELNAVDSSESDQRTGYIMAGCFGLIGLLGSLQGLCMFLGGSRSAAKGTVAQNEQVPFRPPPKG